MTKKIDFHLARAGYLKFSVDGEKSATSARTGITFVKHVHGKEPTFCFKMFPDRSKKFSNYILVNIRIDGKYTQKHSKAKCTAHKHQVI